MLDNRPTASRSGLFILSYQIDGLFTGLRQTVPYGLPVGTFAFAVLKRLKSRFDSISTGPAVEDLPNIDETMSPVDILVAAEVLRSTLLAFLSAEEVEERRVPMGFQSSAGRGGQ